MNILLKNKESWAMAKIHMLRPFYRLPLCSKWTNLSQSYFSILFCWDGLFILNYLLFIYFFLCFRDKNSSGARLQIDVVPSTSKQRKCF